MKWLLGGALIGLIALGATMTVEAPWKLVTGWAPFLVRVLPRVTVEPRTAAVGAAAFVAFAGGIHWLGWAAYRPADGRRWRLRWSLAGVAAVVVLFAAGICLIGVVHQTGWLFAADEPAVVEVERLKYSGSGRSSSDMLRQTALGFRNLDVDHPHPTPVVAPDGTLLHNWVTPALVYIGYSSSINFKEPWDSPENQKNFRAPLNVLINPELTTAPLRNGDGYGLAHYAANCRAMKDGMFRPFKELTSGTSTILLIGEVNDHFEPWGKPGNCRYPLRGINKSPYGFGGPLGSGGAYFAMADGSVRFVSDNVSPDVLKALAIPDR